MFKSDVRFNVSHVSHLNIDQCLFKIQSKLTLDEFGAAQLHSKMCANEIKIILKSELQALSNKPANVFLESEQWIQWSLSAACVMMGSVPPVHACSSATAAAAASEASAPPGAADSRAHGRTASLRTASRLPVTDWKREGPHLTTRPVTAILNPKRVALKTYTARFVKMDL